MNKKQKTAKALASLRKLQPSYKPKNPIPLEDINLTVLPINQEDLHKVKRCLLAINAIGMAGPNETNYLQKVFGRKIARFEAADLMEWVNKELNNN